MEHADGITLRLTSDDVALLCDALDSHEYWQLGHDLPRNDGLVFIPGDFVGDGPDPYWGHRTPTESEHQAAAAIGEARALAARLRTATLPAEGDAASEA